MHLLKIHVLRCINAVGCIKKRHAFRCIYKMQTILSVYDLSIMCKCNILTVCWKTYACKLTFMHIQSFIRYILSSFQFVKYSLQHNFCQVIKFKQHINTKIYKRNYFFCNHCSTLFIIIILTMLAEVRNKFQSIKSPEISVSLLTVSILSSRDK